MKALIVEDEMVVAHDLARILQRLGYSVPATAMRTDEALRMVDQHQPDVIFIDIVLKGERDGIALAHVLRENYSIPFLFITAHADSTTVKRARATQPSGYLVKPFTKDDVYAATEVAMSNYLTEQIAPDQKEDTPNKAGTHEDGGLPPFRLRKVQRYIGEHLDEDLTLARLAEVADISKYHFSHLFKQSVGTPPYRYVILQRIEEAKRLLAQTELSIAQIALRSGFSSHSHFSRTFRKHVGTTPSAFQKKGYAG